MHNLQKEKLGRFFWTGLGLWNVYFILKFIMFQYGYITFEPLYNAVLLLFILLPIASKKVRVLRTLIALVLGAVLFYAESWLPGIESIVGNANAIAGFSATYVLQLIWDFINFNMVALVLCVLFAYLLLSNWIRISFFTIGYFLFMLIYPHYVQWQKTPEPAQAPLEVAQMTAPSQVSAPTTQPVAADGAATSDTIEQWYQAFLQYESSRRAQIPQGIATKDTPFDIILLNVCSLSDDDLQAVNLAQHPVFNRFNIRFDHFNSATAYSGPATLRLLNAACGQSDHNTLYDQRRPECEIMNRFGQLGYSQHLFLDHTGQYDNYLQVLRDKAGLNAVHETANKKLPVHYLAFDDEPISDDLAVMRYWKEVVSSQKGNLRTFSLFNFIALHDGNRLPRNTTWEPFKPRAQVFLDDLNTFMGELEKSGRKVMLVLVPEHGAAVRGDRVQPDRLRDIPSMRITQVPVMVKFFGIKGLPQEQIHVSGNTSYLALASLMGRVLEHNYFGAEGGAVPLADLVRDLPQTNPVSENAQSIVLTYRDNDYVRRQNGQWVLYPKER